MELSDENQELEIPNVYLKFSGSKATENVSKFYF